jgi:hypothetical protein
MPDLRVNLITVPSCETHNLSASKDDEYAMVVVASHFENNPLAAHHFGTKILRALSRSPAFRESTFRSQRPASVDGRPTVAFAVDTPRFSGVMERIARAVHFHEKGTKLSCPLRVYSPAFVQDDPDSTKANNELKAILARRKGLSPVAGTNPLVFTYQFTSDTTADAHILTMTFYGGCDVVALWGANAATPPDATQPSPGAHGPQGPGHH